ncbi:cell division protein FtsA [Rossellomorea vietnamensis]|uniref:Cell division protein FtsA n=1 Tax=Rossellomorea vietnamensis TaxID=218284 RepID=A0A5D4NZP1_9BACI|nr:cell division protein FtsA [Rossellomorea vietnamensis]TYS19785.1 cell division protein FtsA [Rossellomorea vietnamensis]
MPDKKKIFALDIGTRSVVGIILIENENKQFEVIDILSQEHKERAMLDGQIHDVPAVASVISSIKTEMEKKHGPLQKVCVAAAGRALKTETASASISITGKPLLTQEDVLHLELSAVQQAQAIAAHDGDQTYHYYCVGYSVLYYKLDGEEIGSLVDQQGDQASVDIISTFLPKVVVESLLAALNRAGLEMEALTLEPIAAINVLIPASMRRLNVALVDIGAGTSDIALTDMGTIIAFGMVPTAGDEITEAISDALLLDFPLAEEAKRELINQETITVSDILGFETEISREEVVTQISPAIDHLAQEIKTEILKLNNGKPPKAVMLVGGGSLTPELPERLASALELPLNRVAVRGTDAIQDLQIIDKVSNGPELVTPIGIAIAAKKAPVQYVTAYVNEQPIRLFEVKELTIGDCLLAAGLKINKLYGKPGMAMIVSVNGQSITLPGKHGKAPALLKNGQKSSIDSPIQNGDRITVIQGENGEEPVIKISDLIETQPEITLTINQKDFSFPMNLMVNGKPSSLDKFVQDRDTIEVEPLPSAESVLKRTGHEELTRHLRTFHVTINEKETFIPAFSGRMTVNGREARLSTIIKSGDVIEVSNPEMPTLKMVTEKKQMNLSHRITVFFNDKELELSKEAAEVFRSGEKLAEDSLIQTGDKLTSIAKEAGSFIFQDLFRHIEIEMPSNAGGKFLLMKNGEETTFYESIQTGDKLEIRWPLSV